MEISTAKEIDSFIWEVTCAICGETDTIDLSECGIVEQYEVSEELIHGGHEYYCMYCECKSNASLSH